MLINYLIIIIAYICSQSIFLIICLEFKSNHHPTITSFRIMYAFINIYINIMLELYFDCLPKIDNYKYYNHIDDR